MYVGRLGPFSCLLWLNSLYVAILSTFSALVPKITDDDKAPTLASKLLGGIILMMSAQDHRHYHQLSPGNCHAGVSIHEQLFFSAIFAYWFLQFAMKAGLQIHTVMLSSPDTNSNSRGMYNSTSCDEVTHGRRFEREFPSYLEKKRSCFLVLWWHICSMVC